jgi:hypothetical protein
MKDASAGYEQTYNLFRPKGAVGLHCAVPQDHRVPTFLDGTFWEFVGSWYESALLLRFEATSGLLPARLIAPAPSNLCLCLGISPAISLGRGVEPQIAGTLGTNR